jgi:hypothetical protein
MAGLRKLDLNDPGPFDLDEDEETLAAIDESIRDVEAGRVVSSEKARKLLPQWITASFTRKEH